MCPLILTLYSTHCLESCHAPEGRKTAGVGFYILPRHAPLPIGIENLGLRPRSPIPIGNGALLGLRGF